MSTEFAGFPSVTFRFLEGLTKHNEKVWFDAHRAEYDEGYVEPAKLFVAALGPKLKKKISKTISFEPRINGSLFRINRDIRFSKDKSPYKHHLDLWFWEGDERSNATPGYFLRMYSDKLMFGAGMHGLEKEGLEAYRKAVLDPKAGPALVKAIAEVKSKGDLTISEPTRAKVPRGFDAAHPRAALLLHESLFAEWSGPIPKEAKTAAFVDFVADRFARCAPIPKWLLANVANR